MDLSDRIAVVTGAGSGLGLNITRGLVDAGCKRVYILGRRIEKLNELVSGESKFSAIQVDVTDKESISRAVQEIGEREGKIDILVNSAGVPGPSSLFISNKTSPLNETLGQSLFTAESSESWSKVFETNVTGTFFVTMAFAQLLERGAKERGEGKTSCVINISSAAASLKLSMCKFAYSASKAAVDHLTVNMASEFGRNDIPIRVNAIQPGTFPSEMTTVDAEAMNRSLAEKPFCGLMNKAPEVTRRGGRPEEIVVPVNYLASSDFVNGVVLRVDGGICLVNP
ncbi:NAD(P)-binding protein [Marasmius fiardii PR-910]|nr:NAD(P)-binding protein [Marasmius fiardii PR-910]